ncbi:MAG TPA: metalloregulator ArsR/SmtB family transcription factor [Rickettsiales bacterium]|nr:metalloregulator ArsR/SmtB family transcription factor [Rickettsiales bacterium]
MQDMLSATFSALADPTRRAMLARLAQGEKSVKELAEPFNLSQPAISKHLKVLEKAGLVTTGHHAQLRPRKLDTKPLKQLSDWLEHYKRYWDESFDRLDTYLTTLQQQEKDHDGNQ